MLKLNVIGCGAAGNKAAIELIEKNFQGRVTLVNSTFRDIPEKYKNNAVIFGASNESLGGCGKERTVGKKLILKDLQSGNINIDQYIDPDTNVVVLVSSTEGGSGSAVTPILAEYISKVLGIPVIICLFFGFNTDVRGMQNSIEICQELTEDYGVVGISNAAFLDEANGNKLKAEHLANEEFCNIVRILTGQDIHPGSQNIDDTDLYKLVVTNGYMFVGSTSLKGVKNMEMFNKVITNAMDDSKLMQSGKKSAKRIGGIFTIPEEMSDFIDINLDVMTQRYGIPYEMFTHVQTTVEGQNPTMSWIVSGMDLPIDEVKEIYENYKKASESVNKSKDSFFDTIGKFNGNNADTMFNMLDNARPTSRNNAKATNNFFAKYGMTDKK